MVIKSLPEITGSSFKNAQSGFLASYTEGIFRWVCGSSVQVDPDTHFLLIFRGGCGLAQRASIHIFFKITTEKLVFSDSPLEKKGRGFCH